MMEEDLETKLQQMTAWRDEWKCICVQQRKLIDDYESIVAKYLPMSSKIITGTPIVLYCEKK